MEFNEDVPYAVLQSLPDSGLENLNFYGVMLLIQSQESKTLLVVGMIAILMIFFLGVQCFCRNEETSPDEPVEEEEEEEEKEEEEEQARGLFSQATGNIMSFFGR